MKAVVSQSRLGETFGRRSCAWTAERTRRTETCVIDQDHEHVGCAFRRPQITDRRVFGVRIFRVIGRQARQLEVRNRQGLTLDIVIGVGHVMTPFRSLAALHTLYVQDCPQSWPSLGGKKFCAAFYTAA